MAAMTVVTDLMSFIVIMNVPTTNSNAIAMEGASLVHTNVMETKTVRTDLMKLMKFVIIGNVTRKQNFHVRTENVSLSCGNVILITIVATIAMNQLIFAVTPREVKNRENRNIFKIVDFKSKID